ncbi:hypothetical protein A2U01_0087643 [Trifolium medium]|uniref:Uncharacterized protein n=1 Tax=Trifolium medium TaxID=97028 RepID=A0A392U2W5_9FABA|nr:hypothetical protein [Trifolium medium]
MLFATPDQMIAIQLGNHIAKGVTEERTTNTGSPEDHPVCSRVTLPLLPLASTS